MLVAVGGHHEAKPCVLSLETLTVQALSEQPRPGARGCHPALGPASACHLERALDLPREHYLRWSCGSSCVCKSSFGLDRPASRHGSPGFSEGKLRECRWPVSPPVRAFQPSGPCTRGQRREAPSSGPLAPWPELIQSLLCFWALKAGWAGRRRRSMLEACCKPRCLHGSDQLS